MRVLKIIGFVLGGFVLLIGLAVGGFLAYAYGLRPNKRAPQALSAPKDPATVKRGQYLAESVYQCLWCHSEVDAVAPGAPVLAGGAFAGRDWKPEMKNVDIDVVAPNLTPDGTAGIGQWSDGEIVRAMREGIGRDNRPLLDVMPYPMFHDTMSDADALAIVSYLRTVPAVPKPNRRTAYEFPITLVVRFFPEPVRTPYAGPPASPRERGDWLLQVTLCKFCHDGHDEGHQAIAGRELAGGDKWKLRDGTELTVPNISSDKALGIGTMTDADIRRVLDEGIARNGKPLRWMPWSRYSTLEEGDKAAIIAALRAAPATK
jgi:mono/diheme cytochrome c family protein